MALGGSGNSGAPAISARSGATSSATFCCTKFVWRQTATASVQGQTESAPNRPSPATTLTPALLQGAGRGATSTSSPEPATSRPKTTGRSSTTAEPSRKVESLRKCRSSADASDPSCDTVS